LTGSGSRQPAGMIELEQRLAEASGTTNAPQNISNA
jgi:hypothetical protein